MRENETVEAAGCDGVGSRQVGDKRGARVGRIDVNYVKPIDDGAEAARILASADLEHSSANIRRPLRKKLVNVVAIDRRTAIGSPARAQRRCSAYRAQPCRSLEAA